MKARTQAVLLRLFLALCVLFALGFLFTQRNGMPRFIDKASAYDVQETENTRAARSKKSTPSTKLRDEGQMPFCDMGKLLQALCRPLSQTADACRAVLEKRMRCPGYSDAFVATLTEAEQAEARAFYEQGYVFYRQNWSVLNDLPYGAKGNTFGECGCGPTVVAAVISNLAGVPYTPAQARLWAYENHGFIASNGATTYQFMFDLPAEYGISARHVTAKDEVYAALREGALVLVNVGKGDFTFGSHFMLYRGVTENGDILIADSYSYSTSSKPWTWERLSSQVLHGYYIYEKTE